jgi:hypothetical protein
MEGLYISRKNASPAAEFFLKLGLFLLFLQSLNAWFTWELNPFFIPVLSTVMCIPCFLQLKSSFGVSNKKFIILGGILIIAWLFSIGETNFNGYVGGLIIILPVLLIIPLNDRIKLDSLRFFTYGMAVILVPSLITWILLLLGVGLPNLGRISNSSWEYYVYDNYFFCLKNSLLYARRFHSIFLEPGHLGMIAAFLLFVNKFEIKRKAVLIILISAIFTLSLAGYVLIIISFTLYVMLYSKRSLTYLGISLFVVVCGYFFFANYNNGNNIVNEQIISRLKYDDSQGDIVGDNRVTGKLSSYYNVFIDSDEAWYGIGLDRFNGMHFGPSAGIKVFVVQNGIIGTFLAFLFYFAIVLFNRSKFSMALLLIYILAFFQRAYPFWACELLIFITAMPIPAQDNLKIERID